MPGEVIELEGEASSLVAAVIHLAEYDFALVGGLAVMIRLNEAHRVTLDLDGVFDNSSDVPTTATLVAAGVAEEALPPQRVVVMGTDVDVIDTSELPADADELPDDPKGRLFVCAHRYAYETAVPVLLRSGPTSAVVRVATPAALIATKAHALRYASSQRRATKRSSDLHDLYRLAAVAGPEIAESLATAPWDLRKQVGAALAGDVADLEQALALLRRSAVGRSIDGDDFTDVISDLLFGLTG